MPSRSFSSLTSGRDVTTAPQKVEQIEEIRHLDTARIGKTYRQQRRAAADLEFTGIELCRIGIRCTFFKLDGEPILLIEFLRLDHRRQKCAKRRRAEYHDGNRFRCLRI